MYQVIFKVFVSAESHEGRCGEYFFGCVVGFKDFEVVVDDLFNFVVAWMVGHGERNTVIAGVIV